MVGDSGLVYSTHICTHVQKHMDTYTYTCPDSPTQQYMCAHTHANRAPQSTQTSHTQCTHTQTHPESHTAMHAQTLPNTHRHTYTHTGTSCTQCAHTDTQTHVQTPHIVPTQKHTCRHPHIGGPQQYTDTCLQKCTHTGTHPETCTRRLPPQTVA